MMSMWCNDVIVFCCNNYDVMWYDVIMMYMLWCDVVWCDVMWYDMRCHVMQSDLGISPRDTLVCIFVHIGCFSVENGILKGPKM